MEKKKLQEGEINILSEQIIKILDGLSSNQAIAVLERTIQHIPSSSIVTSAPVQSAFLPLGKSELQ